VARALDLAILGGRAAFAEPRHVGRPNIGDRARLHERIEGALERRWLANDGPLVAEFERRVGELVGAEHCVATSSATVGLQLVARALDLRGEVIMPSFTFVGTAHAFKWLGLEPVFADVDRRTHNIDPASVERLITPRTSAIVGVHIWGRPCDVEALEAIAARHDLELIFDAAHALGTGAGSGGHAEVFSFHATKVAGAGEGGAVTSKDAELVRRVRRMRNFGFVEYDRVERVGTNGKMPELSAALGLTSLDALDEFIAVNRRNHACYASLLAGVPGVRLISYPEPANFHYIVLEVDDPAVRDTLHDVLHAENVLARRYFAPGCHRMEPYLGSPALAATEWLSDRLLTLPTGTAISEADIATIGSIVALVVERHEELAAGLAERTTC
jgi:dTDP-4-amino-4,6-dideoxygalactose transaminase